MGKRLLYLLLILFYSPSFGQAKYGFGDGVIITKQNDTIRCQVELAVTYGKKVAYRLKSDGKELSISSNEVKSIQTPYKYWENIQLGKNERLMSLLVDGGVRLFNHVTVQEGVPQSGGITPYMAPKILYAIVKSNTIVEVKKNNFREVIQQTLNECASVLEKVASKDYKFNDLEKVVAEYNSCH